ncbi:hypothetical protein RvY_11512 [Ramazzottius varieornatus]|uniref:Protein kinase domain-containing protein n=1 Tax=Ramazzottius varieornatus TaxID=947166 RepID=A0A1D1VGF2_RAMVA|nr:hypothetical protein RvY_11512 [Ramazzottius varieornatus]
MSFKVEDRGRNQSSWHFIVSETVRHSRGHVLYKVTLQVIPVDVSQSVQEVVWWKRYSEFQVLHKKLAELHAALFLKGSFPSFPKPVILKRKDEEVIEQRRQAAEKVLNFISDFPILCRNELVTEFLKDGQEVTPTHERLDNVPILKPKQLHSLLPTSDSLNSLLTSEELDKPDIGGRFPEVREEFFEGCLSPIQGTWTHLRDEELPSPSESYDITEATDQVLTVTLTSGSLGEFDEEILGLDDGRGDGVHVESLLKDASVDLDEGVEVEDGDEMKEVMSPKKKNNAVAVAPQHSRLLTEGEKKKPDEDRKTGEEDYLFIAGHHLARATDKELAGDYEVAFGLYKLGIDILLKGVQSDSDPVRRDAVRRKAAKYLAKAEQLYCEHVTESLVDSKEQLVHSEYSTAAGTRAELAEYCVVKFLTEKAWLVRHRTSHENVVLKVIHKSPHSGNKRGSRRTIIPLGPQRYMVQLKRFVETDDAIFLILERAPGGRLLDYVSRMVNAESSNNVTTTGENPLKKTDSCSPALSKTSSSSETFSSSWRKLTKSIPSATEEDSSTTDSYAEIFYKNARSRSTSLARVEPVEAFEAKRQSFSTSISVEEGDMVEETEDVFDEGSLIDSMELLREGELAVTVNVDASFLQSVEPSASPTLRGLSNWKDVGELDAGHLIAKSKELLESLDETIYTSGVKLAASPLTRSRSPSPHSRKLNGRPVREYPDAVDGGIVKNAASGEFDWFADKPSCREVGEWVRRKVPESLARVWLLEIVLAVEALHELGIFCVDLAMHNVLLGEKGHIKLTYFSQWSSVVRSFDEPDALDDFYLAPEMSRVGEEPTPSCDVWSIGVILFELVTGKCFANVNPVKPSSHRSLRIPEEVTAEAEDLLRKMLKYGAKERLTLAEVKLHPFCQSFDRKSTQHCL